MEISVGSMIWLTCFTVVSIGGVLVAFPSITPQIFSNLFVFGKSRKSKKWNFKPQGFFLLPKRWFWQFYALGVANALFWMYILAIKHVTGDFPYIASILVQIMQYPQTEGTAELAHCYIVLVCIGIQVTRRCLECSLISVYSKDGKMSIAIYAVGAGYYIGLPLSCVAGSDLSQEVILNDILSQCGIAQVIGVSVFIAATLMQNQVAKQLAKLRHNKKGEVINDRHHVPSGGMFEYVSSPHYLAEILIYSSMAITFSFKNPMMNCLALFVISNQFISAYYSHKWYLENFPKYPKKRKMIFPFLC